MATNVSMEEWRSKIEVYSVDTEPGILIEKTTTAPGLSYELLSRTASVLLQDEDDYELVGVESTQIAENYFRLTGHDADRDVIVTVEVLENGPALEIVSVTSTNPQTGEITTLFKPTAH